MPPFHWQSLSPDVLWYFVGLITSDGSLSKDGRHIDITSKDLGLLRTLKQRTLLPQKISIKNRGKKNRAYHIQIGSRAFHSYLQTIGLFPNKSKSIGAVTIDHHYFVHFLRGVIDGDGGLRNWIHPTNEHEQWSLRITSGSKTFLLWLENQILNELKVRGKIYVTHKPHQYFVLKFGKLAAQSLCDAIYIKHPQSIHLRRKFNLAKKCVASKRGWSKTATVICESPGGGIGRHTGLRKMGLLHGNMKAGLGELGGL